jgi:hypothetical protein
VNALNGLTCLIGLLGPALLILALMRHSRANQSGGELRTRTGVVMGHVYDPVRFRTLDYVVSDEGQNRPEIIVVNTARDSNLLLIEGDDGLTVLEIGPESEPHDETTPLN